jgi:hypothetical protein
MNNQLVKRGDKLDKFRAHFIEGRKLNEADALMLSRYRKAVAMLGHGWSRQTVVADLMADQQDPLAESQAYQVVRDAMKLYGSLEEVDREGMRFVSYENYKALAQECRRNGDMHGAIRAQENADKLYDLFNPAVATQDPNAFLKPVAVLFTTDTDVLLAAQKGLASENEQTEDAEYEEAE